MTAKNNKLRYYNPYEEFKRCSCGRPYFYLESLKRCPVCGRKLVFYGDLVKRIIQIYSFPWEYSTYEETLLEKIMFLGAAFLGRINRDRINAKEFLKEMFVEKNLIGEMIFKDLKEREEKYFKDIMVFLKLFLKELGEEYQMIKEKEKNNKLSEKDPFENLIIKKINYNYCLDAHCGFPNSFPVKSIPKEQILKDLENSSYARNKRAKDILIYSLDHSIEETGKKFEVTRERIRQINYDVFLKLYQNTKEYKQYKELEEKLKKSKEEHLEAKKRYYKSEKERAKQINQTTTID